MSCGVKSPLSAQSTFTCIVLGVGLVVALVILALQDRKDEVSSPNSEVQQSDVALTDVAPAPNSPEQPVSAEQSAPVSDEPDVSEAPQAGPENSLESASGETVSVEPEPTPADLAQAVAEQVVEVEAEAPKQAYAIEAIKAVLILRIIENTTWPREVGDTINLCLYHGDPITEDFLNEKVVGERTIRVWPSAAGVDLAEMDVFYFNTLGEIGAQSQLETIYTTRIPILTIGDYTARPDRHPYMVSLTRAENRVGMKLNLDRLSESQIELSSQVVKLAEESP